MAATRTRFFYYYILLVIVYAGLTLLSAPARATLQRYHLSSAGLRAVNFSVIVPLVAIWFAALYGYQRIRTYGQMIKKSDDGRQVSRLADGLMVIAIGLPLMATIGQIDTYVVRSHPGFAPTAAFIATYGNLLYVLIAFLLISRGSRGLSEAVRQRPSYRATQGLSLLLIAVGTFYIYLITTRADVEATYRLPMLAVLISVVIPYIYVWFTGMLSAYEIRLYSRHVAGVVYRKIWNYVSAGVAMIIVSSIVLQYVTTLSHGLRDMRLAWLLLIVYCLLGLIALGYVLVALGAKRLTRIEEV